VVAEDERGWLGKFGVGYVFSAFFEYVDAAGFRLSFHECFEACFVHAYAGVLFSSDDFFQDGLPRGDVRSHVVEGCPVDFYVQRGVGWSVEDCMECGVFADAVGEEKPCNDAFVDYVQASGVVQVAEVGVGSALA